MSLIALVLKWTGLPTWAMELLAIVLVGAGVWGGVLWWEHKEIQKGVRVQQLADDKALRALQVQANAEAAKLATRAQQAETAYAKERDDNQSYQLLHPLIGASELCHNAYGGSSHLPTAPTVIPGNAGAGPSPQPLPQVPRSDPGISQDRLRLLQALGSRADRVSAQLREFQAR